MSDVKIYITKIALLKVTLLMVLFSPYGWAERTISCIQEEPVLMDSRRTGVGPCEIVQTPEIRTVRRYYPLLEGGPYVVRYWAARVIRTATYEDTYKVYVMNVCRERVVDSFLRKRERVEVIPFDLENPNMSPDVAHTYELAPMTDSEAARAFDELVNQCESNP